ncbi:hypothetical protein D1007_59857 [Hordeum vulgare]|nr:hypothetical protein D1007_59857 [Hordeum vulgare]
MFQSLETRASWAFSDICGEGVSSPLVPDDARYLGFFFRVVECLEAGTEKVHALTEGKSRDLLGQAASDVFSHLICLDPDFDFAAVLGPVPQTIYAAVEGRGPGPAHFPAAVRHNPLPRLFLMGQSPDTLGANMGVTSVAEWPCDR